MPVSSLTSTSTVQNFDVQENSHSSSSDSQGKSTRTSSDVKDTRSNGMLDEPVVWKQLGTAKGNGKLFKGGKWLRNIQVQA